MESDVKIIQSYSFGDAASIYYKLENGLTMAEMFRRINESGGVLGNVTLNEDAERDMQSVQGTYSYSNFLDNVEYFIETLLKSNGENPSIVVSASMKGEPCVIIAYPKTGVIEYQANIKVIDGKRQVPYGLKSFVEKKNKNLDI